MTDKQVEDVQKYSLSLIDGDIDFDDNNWCDSVVYDDEPTWNSVNA
jgi:hypothetical protein